MAIARKPGRKSPDEAAHQFITRAGQGAVAETPVKGRTPAMIRFDRALLARVDRAAKRRGVSRSAWVQYTLSRALDEEDAG